MNTSNPLSCFLCFTLLCLLYFVAIPRALADDLFVIDFEDYGVGNLLETQPQQSEQFRWQVTKDMAEVQADVAHGGKHALRLGPARSAVTRRFDGGASIQPLLSQTQYYDFWVYPDAESSDYIVVARLTDVTGSNFADIHFASSGALKVMTRPENEKEAKLVNLDGAWESRQWNRVTLKLDAAAQKFEMFLGGKLCTKSPMPLPNNFSGKLSNVSFEGPHAEHKSFSCYYDDLRWSDANPLATK
ncbi:MAG: hypothetical protein HY360_09360 [Verrucomicrobia bacterium]|nr:hypothetical protein [Verrucomicrobiota bacterium]